MEKRRIEAANYSKEVGAQFDSLTPFILKTWKTPYINLGYWKRTTSSITEAQLNLVKVFGDFSKLKKDLEVIDVGCGTGEQDFFYYKKYRCKHILGINISSAQIKIALDKLKKHPKYSNHLSFQVDDAHRLLNYPLSCCDRVLALECTQYFDQEIFLEGAWHILRLNGYVCTSELIKHQAFDFKKILSEIKKEIKKKYQDLLYLKGISIAEGLEKTFSKSGRNSSQDEYRKTVEKKGFCIEEMKDVTKNVTGFYPQVKKRIVKILDKPTPHGNVDYLLTTLANEYTLHCLFKAQSLGFHLVRAIKI